VDSGAGRRLLKTTVAEDDVDRLFAVRPAEFVAARDRLSAELKRQGRKDEAAAVKTLPRPSPSAFAVNQLARRDPEGLARLEAATSALERTQGAAAGEEGRRAYREALAEQREALERLVGLAARSLEEAGLGSARTVLDRVSSNLRFAMLDDAARALVRQGRLSRDVEAPDLSVLLERFPPSSAPRAAPHEAAAPPPREAASKAAPGSKKDAAAERLRERLAAVLERHRDAEADLARAREEAEAADKTHQRAEEAVKALRRQLTERESEAAAAARTLAASKRALAHATTALERTAAELAKLERQND
jgi:hypothetical protein